MCIVIIKEKGVKFPKFENVQESCKRNPDGFSMMWNENGIVKTYKSMDREVFLNKYKKIACKNPDNIALVIHARIATHGSVGIKNTHCWTDKRKSIGFAHNGILSIKNRGDMTDSETFFRDIFLPIYESKGINFAKLSADAVIGTSKFAFLNKDGEVFHLGIYTKDEGCLYSNTTYRKVTTNVISRRGNYSAHRWQHSFFNPFTQKYDYKGANESWRDFSLREQSVKDNSFYDYNSGEWVLRGEETDKEWKEKRRKGEYSLYNYGNDYYDF